MATNNRANIIHYRGGYRYQLTRPYTYASAIIGRELQHEYVSLSADGQLAIRRGYCWDGASGPALDTKTIMRASLVHDALYQLARHHQLPASFRAAADDELYHICRADGMNRIRAKYVLLAVRLFGATSADPKNKRKEQSAP